MRKVIILLGLLMAMVALFGSAATAQISTDVVCNNGEWNSKYYSGKNFETLKVNRCEAQGATTKLDKDWSTGAITPMSRTDGASARWSGKFGFGADGGTFKFTATADDGIRVYVDGVNVINEWRDQGATTFTAQKQVTGGAHTIRVDYYENTGEAVAKVGWSKVTEPPPPPTDTDGDGVPDTTDQCPGTAPGTAVDANGCPINNPPPPTSCPTSAPAGYITSSGSPADEIASGQDVFVPSGTYSTGTLSLANGQSVLAPGDAQTTINTSGDGIQTSNNNDFGCFTLATGSAGTTGILTQEGSRNVVGHDMTVRGYKFGSDGAQINPPQFSMFRTDFRNYDYGFHGNLQDCEWTENDFQTGAGWAGMEINGGSNCLFKNNNVQDGVVGLKFLRVWSYGEWGRQPAHDMTLIGNTIQSTSEESTGTDMQGNDNSAARGVDNVSSRTATSVTLASSAWTGQFGNGKYRVAYYDGPCKGFHYQITSQSGRTFNLANDLGNGAGICVPNVGDDVVVGQPFYNFTWRNNVIDANDALTGIDHWGFTYDSIIDNNTISSPNPAINPGNPLLSSIEMSSLQGLEPTGAVTTLCGKAGPVDGIHITNNHILTSDDRYTETEKILIASVKWGGDCQERYHPIHNVISGNDIPTAPPLDQQF